MVKNSPCNAGDVGLIPCQGTKIPQAAEQRRQSTATAEACAPHSPRDNHRAHGPQREIPRDSVRILHAAAKTRESQIN